MEYSSDVKVTFNADKNARFYFVNSSQDYDRIVNRKSYNKIFEMTSESFSKEISIMPNNTFVVHANRGDVEYTLEILENVL